MDNQIARTTDKPGELFIPALGKTIQMVELREDDVYDTIQIEAGAITPDTKFEFFQNLQNKDAQHTNLPQPRRIASGDEIAMYRVGLHPRGAQGSVLAAVDDIRQVAENGHFLLKFNKRIIADGPAVKYPTGYGLSAGVSGGGATQVGAVSIGVPSVAAAPTLFVPQQLKDNDDLYGKLTIPAASWVADYANPTTSADLLVSCFLRGVIKSPLGK